ncbi:MAG: ATP-binding cassette domain-containing protein [Deltaproteobacteria bacterium]|nr:ATP-binding cassette domain-containing protein [Deltaproteobacteria bacterium]
MTSPHDPIQPPPSTRIVTDEPLIVFSGVRKRFGPKVVYDGLDLTVNKGETLTILGGSGVGKSVMLKMLIGLLHPDEGSITFGGLELTKLNDREYGVIRRRIGMLFQGAALFDSLSVAENVAYGLHEHQHLKSLTDDEIEHRVARSLELVGLPGVQEMYPADLSGGMKKRVGLARCIAVQPEVILFDEPTTGLDPINTARINNLIKAIAEALKVTIMVVTHDMGTAFDVSDRLAMVHRGRILLQGTPRMFRESEDPRIKNFIHGIAPPSEDVATLLQQG